MATLNKLHETVRFPIIMAKTRGSDALFRTKAFGLQYSVSCSMHIVTYLFFVISENRF